MAAQMLQATISPVQSRVRARRRSPACASGVSVTISRLRRLDSSAILAGESPGRQGWAMPTFPD